MSKLSVFMLLGENVNSLCLNRVVVNKTSLLQNLNRVRLCSVFRADNARGFGYQRSSSLEFTDSVLFSYVKVFTYSFG